MSSRANKSLMSAVAASHHPREFHRGIFDYDRDFPPEVIAEVQDLIESLAWLLPGWCQRVRVTWYQKGDADGILASCGVSYEYRTIDIDIYPALLSNDAGRRREVVTHEMIHGCLNPLFDFARDEIRRLLPDENDTRYRDSLFEGLRSRVESVTQDFAYAIHNHEKSQKGVTP